MCIRRDRQSFGKTVFLAGGRCTGCAYRTIAVLRPKFERGGHDIIVYLGTYYYHHHGITSYRGVKSRKNSNELRIRKRIRCTVVRNVKKKLAKHIEKQLTEIFEILSTFKYEVNFLSR